MFDVLMFVVFYLPFLLLFFTSGPQLEDDEDVSSSPSKHEGRSRR